MFTQAIVRKPGNNFANGLTTVGLGEPDYTTALKQHEEYCRALQRCGLSLVILDPDLDFPDSTFVEDTAVLTSHSAILTHPGAPSRVGEVAAIRPVLAQFYSQIYIIAEPGTIDGGDICEAGDDYFIGISGRTNTHGAGQLARFLELEGFRVHSIDIRAVPGILHLKSGLAYLGNHRLVVVNALADRPELNGFEIVHVSPTENYAANCVRINDFVLIAAGFPGLKSELEKAGYSLLVLNVSEFQKMDGGLSCLSLRFKYMR